MPKVLILGGGFGGLAVLKELFRRRRELPTETSITLINRESYHLYTPRLYEVFERNPQTITVDLPATVKKFGAQFIQGTVVELDPNEKTLRLHRSRERLKFDELVVALGSEVDFFGIPGMREHAYPCKTLEDAIRLKDHIDGELLEAAKAVKDGRRAKLRVVVVGGGPTGVELAAAVSGYFRTTLASLGLGGMGSVLLIEAEERILPMFPARASGYAAQVLRALKVELLTNRMVREEHTHKLLLKHERHTDRVTSETVVWTGGVCCDQAAGLLEQFPHDHAGRVLVSEALECGAGSGTFVIGDAAATGEPQLAQAAIRQGETVATSIVRRLKGQPPVRYEPGRYGALIPLGRKGLLIAGRRVFFGRFPNWLRSYADWRYLRELR